MDEMMDPTVTRSATSSPPAAAKAAAMRRKSRERISGTSDVAPPAAPPSSAMPAGPGMAGGMGGVPQEHAPGWGMAEKIHSLLPGFLSARAAVMRKRQQMQQIDQQMADGQR